MKTSAPSSLTPAGEKDAEPKFGSKDNILLETATRQHTHIKTYYVHSAYTTELTPGTKYFYRVGCPEEDKWSPWGVFTTDDGDDSFSFLFVTDMQSDGDKHYQILSENIRKAISESPQAEFVLSTGDQIEYGFLQGDWDKFFRYIQDVIPNNTFAVVNGNHEISTYLMEANFLSATRTRKILLRLRIRQLPVYGSGQQRRYARAARMDGGRNGGILRQVAHYRHAYVALFPGQPRRPASVTGSQKACNALRRAAFRRFGAFGTRPYLLPHLPDRRKRHPAPSPKIS